MAPRPQPQLLQLSTATTTGIFAAKQRQLLPVVGRLFETMVGVARVTVYCDKPAKQHRFLPRSPPEQAENRSLRQRNHKQLQPGMPAPPHL